ncbi:cytosolic sulfotransferase 15-like [Pistacia vera]|uniref:cytosolic sulfotransferase 15-like n=1 Tax=Pistacia vera TaxID=55513 RepID=UPI001262E1ED|nr:cytosolic sulfotransferase 15-like [Pistacia vera]
MEKKIESLGEKEEELSDEIEQLLTTLPKVKNWNGLELCQYQGFWCGSRYLRGMIRFQRQFEAQDNDITLATFPKCGTTWLKALIFTIANRSKYSLDNSPLLSQCSRELVPSCDQNLFMRDPLPVLEDLPKPRIFATHAPYPSLPNSIKNSNCRIVYICRNPSDQFVSNWKFMLRIRVPNTEPISIDEAFEMACQGKQSFGPIWEHVLGYWKASKEEPHKVLFLKYEDLKENNKFYVKQLADFIGYPFTKDEEKQGKVEEISKFCSFDNMSNLEVNKNGEYFKEIKNDIFFRKGSVGDWKNYLTPSMSEHLEKIIEEKLSGSGLTFKKTLEDP